MRVSVTIKFHHYTALHSLLETNPNIELTSQHDIGHDKENDGSAMALKSNYNGTKEQLHVYKQVMVS